MPGIRPASALPICLLVVLVVGSTACSRSGDSPVARAGTTPVSASGTASAIEPSARSAESGQSEATTVSSTPSTPTTSTTSGATSSPTTSTGPDTAEPSITSTTAAADPGTDRPIAIRLRLDRRVDDAATAGFATLVQAVLTDERGWGRAGFAFTFDDADFDYTVVLADGPEVDALCRPYDTYGWFSCQNGPVVALNADRWRSAVDEWPASLDDYRTMLVNHEVGHLLGQHHPASRCGGAGQPAPVMAQQSSGVVPCAANPWPLEWEIACAGQGVEPLAPPFERDIELTCGPDGPVG